MKSKLSHTLRRDLKAYGDREDVIVTQRCRQLQGRLKNKGYETEYLPIVDAVAMRMNHREIARMSTRNDVHYIERNERVLALMDRARDTVGASPRPRGATGKGVNIAILDTGIHPQPDFEGRILAFHDIINGQSEPYDDHGHGTMCAGCAAGSGEASGGKYQGIAPGAELVVVKAMEGNGSGSILNVVRAMQWISDNRNRYGIRVLSLSLGIESEDAFDSMMRGVEALWRQGIVVVAAAGNSGPGIGTINSPGKAGSIITVGAVDDRGEQIAVADFSSRGPVAGTQKPDVCAPGVQLMTTDNRGYGLFTGTSAAAPVAAGCAALILERNPLWTPNQVKREMLYRARSIHGEPNKEGYGYLYISDIA